MPKYETRDGVIFSDETEGAVVWEDCPTRRGITCRCEPLCVICGQRKHAAIHGPLIRNKAGSKPYGHKYQPSEGT